MGLLLDANLSWRLARVLSESFPGIIHVSSTDLRNNAPDSSLWEYARKNGYTIVTNDEDFSILSTSRGFPPKVILLRTGNQSTSYLAQLLISHKEEILSFIEGEEYGVLEIY